MLLEDRPAQSLLVVGRQLDPLLPGQLDQRRQAQRAVQVEMEVGLRDLLDELLGDDHRARASWMTRAISGLWRAISSSVEALQLMGEDEPFVGLVDVVIGPAVRAVVAGLEIDRRDADVVGRVAPRKAVQGVDDGHDAQAGVVDVVHDQQAVRRVGLLDDVVQAVDPDRLARLLDALVGGRADGDVIGGDPVVLEQLLHGDAHRRAAPPDADDEIGPEAAFQDLEAEPERIVQQVLGLDVLFFSHGRSPGRAQGIVMRFLCAGAGGSW